MDARAPSDEDLAVSDTRFRLSEDASARGDVSDTSFRLSEDASARGRSTPEAIRELDYDVPEERPPLDLGEGLTPMNISHWHVERAHSPVPSYTSMESEGSHQSDKLEEEAETSTRVLLERTDSSSSCCSLDSDDCDCEKQTKKTRVAASNSAPELPVRPELFKNPDEERHPALTFDFTFKAIRKTLEKLVEDYLWDFKVTLWKRYPECFSCPPHGMDMEKLVNRLLEVYDLEVALQLTTFVLRDMGENWHAEYLQNLCIRNEVRYDLKLTLKEKYTSAYEGFAQQGEPKAFDSIYTESYMALGGNFGPNIEHEVRTIAQVNTKSEPEQRVTVGDITQPPVSEEEHHITAVLSIGAAGSGKSMAVQRFILDWAEGRRHHHVYLLFPLPFRELNRLQDTKLSLLDIVWSVHPLARKLQDFNCDDGWVMFVCDGLEEYNRELDYPGTQSLFNPFWPAQLHVVVTNLVRTKLRTNGLLWITSRSRPGAQLHPYGLQQLLEVRGFADEHKEAYFRQRFEDPALADRVIAHLTSCKTLHIMCHLPLFCWVVCGEFQRAVRKGGPQAKLPRGITRMYTLLLSALMRVRDGKADVSGFQEENYSERDFLMKLGKMAFVMLENGETLIKSEHWKESGLRKREAVRNSGLCQEFQNKQFVLYLKTVHTFIHPTVQEYLAALYVFLSFKNLQENVLDVREQPPRSKFSRMFENRSLDLHRCALELALRFPDGRFDLFLRFLLGMALPANKKLLQRFMNSKPRCSSTVVKAAATLLRNKMKENSHPEKSTCLELCLEELGVEGRPGPSRTGPSRTNSVDVGMEGEGEPSRSNSVDVGMEGGASRSNSVNATSD